MYLIIMPRIGYTSHYVKQSYLQILESALFFVNEKHSSLFGQLGYVALA
jgi:hypothetical protein